MEQNRTEKMVRDNDRSSAARLQGVGAEIPARVKVSVGWPSKKALASNPRVGECWSEKCSKDGLNQIFISPKLDEPAYVSAVLLHELVHAAVGLDCGHKGEFKRVAKALGLEGQMTATNPGPALEARLNALVAKLPAIPHAELGPDAESNAPKKQTTRLVKVACPECEYTVRTTAKWLEVGLPTCPCGEEMQEQIK
jgi:hypothetical protein